MVVVSAGRVGGTRGSGIMSRCVWVWLGRRRSRGGVSGLGFGLYQSCENRGSVGRVSVFGLRRCG